MAMSIDGLEVDGDLRTFLRHRIDARTLQIGQSGASISAELAASEWLAAVGAANEATKDEDRGNDVVC
jgi:hypothetical protein